MRGRFNNTLYMCCLCSRVKINISRNQVSIALFLSSNLHQGDEIFSVQSRGMQCAFMTHEFVVSYAACSRVRGFLPTYRLLTAATGVSKTKTYENEDRRPKMGLRNYENEDPLRKRRPIFVFVLRKRRPTTKTKTHLCFRTTKTKTLKYLFTLFSRK